MKLRDHSGRDRLEPEAAFTLLELLVVIAMLALLVGLVTPAINSILVSGNLTRGGQMLVDEINLARQTAAARNRPVEVRLFQLSSKSADGYSAAQLWMSGTSGNLAPITTLAIFPSGIVVAPDPALSKAFVQAPAPLPTAKAGAVTNAPYVSFQVRPSGILVPALDMNSWYMTVLPARFAKNTSLPENYMTVQVNPFTATPRVYRP